jgi:hypothetical protein
LKDSYEQLKDTLSECKAKNCTLNEEKRRQNYDLDIKSKDLEKALIKLKNVQSMLEKKQKNMATMGEDTKTRISKGTG